LINSLSTPLHSLETARSSMKKQTTLKKKLGSVRSAHGRHNQVFVLQVNSTSTALVAVHVYVLRLTVGIRHAIVRKDPMKPSIRSTHVIRHMTENYYLSRAIK